MGLIQKFFKKSTSKVVYSQDNQLAKAVFDLVRNNNVVFYDENPKTFIESGYVRNPHARAVIDYIAENVSRIRFRAYEVVDEKSNASYNRLKSLNRHSESIQLRTKALRPIDNEIINRFFDQPNETQSFKEFIFESVAYKKLMGNNFIYSTSPEGFKSIYTKAYNMPSQHVELVEGTWMQPVQAYSLMIDNRFEKIPVEQVLHRKTWNPRRDGSARDLYGLSPMSSLLRSLQRSNESYDASLGLMENGAPLGLLSPKDGSVTLTPEEMRNAEKRFKEKYGGGKNKGKVFQSSVPINWQSIGLSPADLQILESNLFDLQDFCRVYQLSSILVSDNTSSTYNNMEEAEKRFWQNVAIPELEDIKWCFTRFFVDGWEKMTGKKIVIDYDVSGVNALQDNLTELNARLISQLRNGVITPRELLKQMEQPEGEAAHLDDYIRENNIMKINIINDVNEIQ